MGSADRFLVGAIWVVVTKALGSVGFALVSQHVHAMAPCAWCILQRLQMILGAGVALSSLVPAGRWRGALLAGASAIFLSGLGAALYQVLVASKVQGCAFSVAARIVDALRLESLSPALFQIQAGCAESEAALFGLPYGVWSGLAFLGLAIACGALAVRCWQVRSPADRRVGRQALPEPRME